MHGHEKRNTCFTGATDSDFPFWRKFLSLLKSCKNLPFSGQKSLKNDWIWKNWEYFLKNLSFEEIFCVLGSFFPSEWKKIKEKNVPTDQSNPFSSFFLLLLLFFFFFFVAYIVSFIYAKQHFLLEVKWALPYSTVMRARRCEFVIARAKRQAYCELWRQTLNPNLKLNPIQAVIKSLEEPLIKMKYIVGVKGHAGVSRDQP